MRVAFGFVVGDTVAADVAGLAEWMLPLADRVYGVQALRYPLNEHCAILQ